MYLKIFFLALLYTHSLVAQEVYVNAPVGQFKGSTKYTYKTSKYYGFYSIRYGQAPVGALRFQAPVAVDSFSGTYDATTANGVICYQVTSDSNSENEDCLFLNVYSPNPWTTAPMPVMFYIYGGGFNSGSAGGYDPGFFMDSQNVIVVTLNYRVGPFGFLSTGDGVIPGNAGLKDQLLALKWVQSNIAAFGGDPNQVTIFGQSAGAASVAYHLVSPQSAGLFKAAICGSGTALNPWAYNKDQVEMTYGTAAVLNSQFQNSRDSSQLFSYLQNIDARQLDAASQTYSNSISTVANQQVQQAFFYAPVIETHNNNPFVTQLPYEAIANGSFNKVPLLIGTVAEEGLLLLNEYTTWILSQYDSDPSLLVPKGMHVADQNTLTTVGKLIKQEYSPNGDFQYNTLAGIQFQTEQDFQKSLIKHAYLQSAFTNVYFYLFSYSGQMGENTVKLAGSGDVTHSEDLHYIWEWSNPTSYPQTDQTVHERLVKIYTNFALYQNPTPSQDSLLYVTWPTVQPNNFEYVEIGAELSVKNDFKKERYDFWNNLYQTYGVGPFEVF
ncbi:venom carboxylesterase-6-like [Cylas formicarius]|uniref:venom carboxylesterase-6-like n=1 Tax=Cylas formicarius TaxID=197179 RepID=UPI0029583403|nr:venom carboxylesterase-6-like [Cylas formicarius]